MLQTIHISEQHVIQNELIGQLLDHPKIEDIGGSHHDKFDGIYCGIGQHNKSKFVFIIHDFGFKGGSSGVTHALQFIESIETAITLKCPLLMFISTGGARLQEGILAIHHSTKIVHALSRASGYIPTISIIKGPCAALGAYLTSIADFAIFVEDHSQVFLTGPKVIEAAIGKKVDKESLGGLKVHTEITGIATQVAKDFDETQAIIKRLLQTLWNQSEIDIKINPEDGKDSFLSKVLPQNDRATYDMNHIINRIIDEGSATDFIPRYAKNLITCFGQINGSPVGIVANQPKINSGCLDVKSARKLGRFIQICDAYQVPMVFLIDCPGFLPGEAQEKLGAVSIGTRTSHLLASSTCVKVSVIIRRIIGGAYGVMNSKSIGADFVMAWPTAQIAIMSNKASNKVSGNDSSKISLQKMLAEGVVDQLIEQEGTKVALIKAINHAYKNKKANALPKHRRILPM